MIVFGPIPSRRLGRSLGINNIPSKRCVYDCVYCQAGRTLHKEVQRQSFYTPEEIHAAVCVKLQALLSAQQSVDYISFVPEGEPTLDIRLGRTIDRLRDLGHRIAVITNAALLWREDVREDVGRADWVSLKVDAVQPQIWRRVNRALGFLDLDDILGGMLAFARGFEGILVTETMLTPGVNDDDAHLREVAEFVARIDPDCAYLGTPTRAPLESWVQAPEPAALQAALDTFRDRIGRVVPLAGEESTDFVVAGDAVEELLGILAVHPMRREAVERVLVRAGHGPGLIEELQARKLIARKRHAGREFYVAAPALP